MYAGYLEEGDRCPECHQSALEYPGVEGCCCHINPPCSACVNNVLTCPSCGWEDESPDHVYITVAPGLSMRENKPRPLDKTKIDYRIKMHSSCSQICEGVYPKGTTVSDVKKVVDGTFGGRFEQFGGGKFRFIAYTD